MQFSLYVFSVTVQQFANDFYQYFDLSSIDTRSAATEEKKHNQTSPQKDENFILNKGKTDTIERKNGLSIFTIKPRSIKLLLFLLGIKAKGRF